MSDDILVARDVSKSFSLGKHRVDVLKGVTLHVQRRETVVITGRSGVGKSTLLHLLGGLDVPTTGEIAIDGASLFAMSGTKRTRLRNQRLGFVFQSYNLLPELDALENVCVPALVAGHRGQDVFDRANELLAAVGLAERVEHRPAELSGGEQQRVAIARAMMNRPALLLADEPTGNLDSKTGDMILDLLWQMRFDSGTTLIMVTHDEHVAKRGERVLRLSDGRLIG